MLSLIVAVLLVIVGGAGLLRATDEYRKVPRDSWHVLVYSVIAAVCIIIGFIMLLNLGLPAREGAL